MRRDRLRKRLRSAVAGDSPATRRRFLAAAAGVGMGFGIVGTRSPGSEVDRVSASRGRDVNVTRAATSLETERVADRGGSATGATVLGANLNGRPRGLRDAPGLIAASETTWVRAFLDVRRKLSSGRAPADDPDVLALREVAREQDCRLVVSLKWDFSGVWGDKPPVNVPPPGSSDERELFRCASRYLEAIGVPIDVVVLGNEPMWETLDEDIRVDDPPVVRFTRDLKDYLVEHGDHGDPSYLVGAFNRAHRDDVRERQFSQFYRGAFDLVREDDGIDGIDLHIHYDSFAEAERAVAVAREAFPEEMITVTEISPVWRYERNVNTPIARFEAGERFAREHGLPDGMTAVEYFEYAKRDPRPSEEVADFYAAMPWYNVDHLVDVYTLFAEYGVEIGTFGFLAGAGMRNEDWTAGWTPFHINFLFQPALIETDDGIENAANLHYIDDYRERASSGGWNGS